MRKASLILSIVPFVVALVLIAALYVAEGYEGLGVLVIMLFTAPALMVVSIIGLVLAFWKTANLALNQAAKIMSIISVAIFGSAGVLCTAVIVNSMIATNNYGPGVTYHG